MKKILIILISIYFIFWITYWYNNLNHIKRFDWILSIDNYENINFKSQIIDLDVLDTPKKVIDILHKDLNIVIWYINVWAIENYRDDYKDFSDEIVWRVYPWWEDEKFLDIKNYDKFKYLILNRLDIAKEKWFDWIEPDNMDTFDNQEETWFKITKEDEINYIKWLNKEVKKRWMFLIQKNAPELSNSLDDILDWVLIEWAFYNNIFKYYLNYIKKWKIVLNVEYTDNTNKDYFLQYVCKKSNELWFISILKNRDLDDFILECPANKKNILENKLNNKLDILFWKIERKFNLEQRKKIIKRTLIKINKLINKTHNKQRLLLLDLIKQRFLVEQHIYNSKKLIIKKWKKYFWAFQFFWNLENKVTKKKLDDFKNIVIKTPWFATFTQDFSIEWIKYPKNSINEIKKAWEIPLIRFMLNHVDEKMNKTYTLEKIFLWDFDKEFILWADEVKKEKIPILIDFAVEANWNWFSYSHKPDLFKKAYRHIIDIFRNRWVKNVTWFFHVNMISYPDEKWNKPKQYYPWDEYIDWIWVSLYWAQSVKDDVQDFEEALKYYSKDILEISKNKPIALLEFWIPDFWENYSKVDWLENTFKVILNNKYLNFQLINYWHEKWEDEDTFADLRINSSIESQNIFNKYLNYNIFTNKLNFTNE